MKLKNLNKKIRRLEKRLQEGPSKLAKLKRKMEAMATADAETARKKSATRHQGAHKPFTSLTPILKKPEAKPAVAKKPVAAKKVKRKLNLSPERRAQLAAAMKARWAAKRAAAEANPQGNSTNQGSASSV
jgi:hypothetical protein